MVTEADSGRWRALAIVFIGFFVGSLAGFLLGESEILIGAVGGIVALGYLRQSEETHVDLDRLLSPLDSENTTDDDDATEGDVEERSDVEISVSGTVSRGDRGVGGATVQAFGPARHAEQLVDETTTESDGQYQIRHRPTRVGQTDREQYGLHLRVVGTDGALLAETEVQAEEGSQTTTDISVPSGKDAVPTEYTQVRTVANDALDDQSLAELSDDQAETLRAALRSHGFETDPSPGEVVAAITAAASLAATTPFDQQFLYALARSREQTDRDSLADSNPEALAEDIQEMAAESVVDIRTDDIGATVAETVERLRHGIELESGTEVSATVSVRTEDDSTLAGVPVRVSDPEDERSQATYVTDDDGEFTIAYMQSPDDTEAGREFTVAVRNEAGATVHDETVTLRAGKTTTISVPEWSSGVAGNVTLETLDAERGIPVPETGLDSDVTLGTIRHAGGVENLDATADLDASERETIDALSTLDVLTDPETGYELVEGGYSNQLEIAASSLAEFQTTMAETLDPERAATIHANARAQTYLLDNVLVDRRAQRRNGSLRRAGSKAGEH